MNHEERRRSRQRDEQGRDGISSNTPKTGKLAVSLLIARQRVLL